MPRIALITCRELPEPDPDQDLLLDTLRAAGLQADMLAWDDAADDPGRFDLCVLRSCWNYYERPEEFLAWIADTAEATRLLNPEPVVRWNLHKRYLDHLASRGIPTVPTAWCDRGRPADLGALMQANGWDDVIVKPAVSASSWRTRRFGAGDLAAGRAFLADLVSERDAMVQPWLSGIETEGERSVVWIAGRVTHAVTKQLRLAGADERLADSPPLSAQERDLAERAIAAVEAPAANLLYGRLDLLPDGQGGLLVSELELMEPSLYLRESPEALGRFVGAIADHAALREAPPGG